MKQSVNDLSFNSETYSSKPQDFVPMLEIKCRSHKFQAGTRSPSHSLSPPLPFEHTLHKFQLLVVRHRGNCTPEVLVPISLYQRNHLSEGTNGYLWHLLAYQITSWPPGSLSTSAWCFSGLLASPLSISFSFPYNLPFRTVALFCPALWSSSLNPLSLRFLCLHSVFLSLSLENHL